MKINRFWLTAIIALIYLCIGICPSVFALMPEADPVSDQVYVEADGRYGHGYVKRRGEDCFVIAPKHIVHPEPEGLLRPFDVLIIGANGSQAVAQVDHELAEDVVILRIKENGKTLCSYQQDTTGIGRIGYVLLFRDTKATLFQKSVQLEGADANFQDVRDAPESHIEIKQGDSGASLLNYGKRVGMLIAVDRGKGRVIPDRIIESRFKEIYEVTVPSIAIDNSVNVTFSDMPIKLELALGGYMFRVALSGGTTPGYLIQYSIDGLTFSDLSQGYTIVSLVDRPQLFLRIIDSTGKEVLRKDKTEFLIAEMSRKVAHMFGDAVEGKNSGAFHTWGFWGCNLGGCRFKEYSNSAVVCSPFVSDVEIGYDGRTFPYKLNRTRCLSDKKGIYDACYTYSDISLPPGQWTKELFLRITFLDGNKMVKLLRLDYDQLKRLTDNDNSSGEELRSFEVVPEQWTLLNPATEGDSGKSQPLAAISFLPSLGENGGYRLYVAAVLCPTRAAIAANMAWFVDDDGLGFLRARYHNSRAPDILRIAEPHGNRSERKKALYAYFLKDSTELVIEGRAGEEIIGPYRYRVNPKEAFEQAVKRNRIPRVLCEKPRVGSEESTYCFSADSITWVGAHEIRFGTNPNNLNEVLEIKYGATEFFQGLCNVYERSCPFFYKVPTGATDVYWQATMGDGATTRVARIPIGEP